MAPLSLKIVQDGGAVTRKVKLEPSLTVLEATAIVKEKALLPPDAKPHGLFIRSPDNDLAGIWLEDDRTLAHYMLRDGDKLDYMCKIRNLRLRMLDGAVKTLQVDQSRIVGDLMISICSKLAITNHEEYGLCFDPDEATEEKENKGSTGTLTSKKKSTLRVRDLEFEQLSKKLKTDDNVEWIDLHKTLSEACIDPTRTLLLKRRLYYSDRKVDSRDPVQLNLLYVQARDNVLTSRHPVTEAQGVPSLRRPGRGAAVGSATDRITDANMALFNKTLDIKLIRLVRDNPVLYNPGHSKHSDFDTRVLTWQKIGEVLYKPAAEFAGIQCHIQFGDYIEEKHKAGLIENLNEYLPEQYCSSWGMEKKIFKEWSKHVGTTELEAKHLYTKTARSLPTYGVTFFLVKEVQKGKKKLIHRLLGINAEAILRLDERTKEIIETWPLTHVKTYSAGKGNSFTLNFGDYTNEEYSVKTRDGFRIRDILEGYIDLIRKRMLANYNHSTSDQGYIAHDNVGAAHASTITMVSNNPMKVMEQSFVGPSKIVQYEPGQTATSGAQIVTVQQMMTSGMIVKQGQGVKSQVPMKDVLNRQASTRLKRMNSKSVKVVTLLTEPNDSNIEQARKLVEEMIADMPFVKEGVQKTAENQTEESRKKLEDQMHELDELVKLLSHSTEPGHVNTSEAEAAAIKIAEASTKMYLSMDPGTQRRSLIITRQRESFIADERTEKSLRHASYIAASGAIHIALNDLQGALHQEYKGPPVEDNKRVEELERSAIDKLGKINAAIAHHMLAHSDPSNVDYGTAVNSLHTIQDLMPDLARDAQALASIKDGRSRQDLLAAVEELSQAVRDACSLTGTHGNQEVQEVVNKYTQAGSKLMFILGRGAKPMGDKEKQVTGLAYEVDSHSCALVQLAQELSADIPPQPGLLLYAAATRVLDHCAALCRHAELTSPTISEPHCRSALTATCESLSTSVQHLAATWTPLVEDRKVIGDKLHKATMDVANALDKLMAAYANLGENGEAVMQDTSPEHRKLKFIHTLGNFKKSHDLALDELDKPVASASAADVKQADIRISDNLGQINAAIATLAQIYADNNKDYAAAESAISTINDLMPRIAKDVKISSANKEAEAQAAMLEQLRDLYKAMDHLGAGPEALTEETSLKFAEQSGKLYYCVGRRINPHREDLIMDAAVQACNHTSLLLAGVQGAAVREGGERGGHLDLRGAELADRAQSLIAVAQITAPSISQPACKARMLSTIEDVSHSAQTLRTACDSLADDPVYKDSMKEANDGLKLLEKQLDELRAACNIPDLGEAVMQDTLSPEHGKLKFIHTLGNFKKSHDLALDELDKPVASASAVDVKQADIRISENLGQINAAIATLAQIYADNNTDYDAAESAMSTINELMPQIAKDVKISSANKEPQSQAAMLEQLRDLYKAMDHLGAGPEALTEETSLKFAEQSGKLYYCVGRRINPHREDLIMDAAVQACNHTSLLLAGVQGAAVREGGERGGHLDLRGAELADRAQSLIAVAQITAPSISQPACKARMLSTIEDVSHSAQTLRTACDSLADDPVYKDSMKEANDGLKLLEKQLDELRAACNIPDLEIQEHTIQESPQEKQKLQFIMTVQGAKDKLGAAEKELDKPTMLPKGSDIQTVRRRLADRLAALQLAIDKLQQATNDVEKPDYVSAQQAMNTITELMPLLVRDTKTVSSCDEDGSNDAMLEQVRRLCQATDSLCLTAHDPQGFKDAVNKCSESSNKLVYIITPRAHPETLHNMDVVGPPVKSTTKPEVVSVKPATMIRPEVPTKPKPEVPKRTTAQSVPNKHKHHDITQEFLNALRAEESQGHHIAIPSETQQKVITKTIENLEAVPILTEEEIRAHEEFVRVVEDAVKNIKRDEKILVKLSKAENVTEGVMSNTGLLQQQQQLQKNLSLAGVEVVRLVAASYVDNLDYAAASKSITKLTELMSKVAENGKNLSNNVDDACRKAFLQDVIQVCTASRNVCDAAQNDRKKLNEAAVEFGDKSSKLLSLVSDDLDPALEKEIISRAKAIGTSASRLASDTSTMMTSASDDVTYDMCHLATECVHAAGKLIYTARVVAPMLHEPCSQEALITSTDTLSSKLQLFRESLLQISNPQDLTKEADTMEKLLEELRRDVKGGTMMKKREMEQLEVENTPMRQLTVKVLDGAKAYTESPDLPAPVKVDYASYSDRLGKALRALDLANARCKKTPHDTNKRRELENAVQNLQMILLQSRPTRGEKGNSNIVDLRDFIEEVSTEAKTLTAAAYDVDVQNEHDKQILGDIREKCGNIETKAQQLMNFDDILEIDQLGQECDDLINQINKDIQGIQDAKAKRLLLTKLLPLTESTNMLRFATKSSIAATSSASLDSTLDDLDDMESRVIQTIVEDSNVEGVTLRSKQPPSSNIAATNLCRELISPEGVTRATLTAYIASTKRPADNKVMRHLYKLVHLVKALTVARSRHAAMWQPLDSPLVAQITEHIVQEIQSNSDKETEVIDIAKLLIPSAPKILSDNTEQEESLQALSTQLSSLCGELSPGAAQWSTTKPTEQFRRRAPALVAAAGELDAVARGTLMLHPMQKQQIDEAAKEMKFETYNVLQIAECAARDPRNTNLSRRLAAARERLNSAINKLVRCSSSLPPLSQTCISTSRDVTLRLHDVTPRAAPAPFDHAVTALDQQKENIYKLKSVTSQSRQQFLRDVEELGAAVRRSTDLAENCAYYISVSDEHKDVAQTGLVDVDHIHRSIESIQDSCLAIIGASEVVQAKDELDELHSRVQQFSWSIEKAQAMVKDEEVKMTLVRTKASVCDAAHTMETCLKDGKDLSKITSVSVELLGAVSTAHSTIEQCELVPTVRVMAPGTKGRCDEVIGQSKSLLTHTMELLADVKAVPPQQETVSWNSFPKRKNVIDSYDALLKTVKVNGHRSGILLDVPEEELEEVVKKSYLETQVDLANKWLKRPTSKADVKAVGHQAVRNIVDLARQMSEDLSGADREDTRHLLTETEELLCQCNKVYSQEKNAVLMDRIKEIKKGIQRGVVTRVVEDFMLTEDPLEDLEILAHTEKDANERAFILERKIAMLLGRLGRVSRTARLVAAAGNNPALQDDLTHCSEQTELLAPMLVKAAQQRIDHPDDQAVVENYKSLLAQYGESITKVRNLCDCAVNPMDFVQAAGDTMHRMREDMTHNNDPQKCHYTSSAINRLANRVMYVGRSSPQVQRDPALSRELDAVQSRLRSAIPAPDTRQSRMPDWKESTAQVIRMTGDVESALGGENIFKQQPTTANQPIYSVARDLHESVREWSSRDNEIVGTARRMAVLMARLSEYMESDEKQALITTSKSIVSESQEVAELAKKLAHECTDVRIKTNLLQLVERIPTISGQLKMLITVKGSSLGQQGNFEDKEAMDMLVVNAQSLMMSIQEVVKAAAGASVKIMSQRGPRLRWVRKNYY